MNRLSFLPLALLACASTYAEEAPTFGHSMQGDAFNEGPRQLATLMPGLENVHFPVTTKSADAQKFIDQGVCQLHGFWYFEAERSFRQAAWHDPDCAIAYWGMMMANVNNEKRAAEFIKEAVKRRAKASPREQRWIDMWSAYYAPTKKDEKARRDALVKAYEELIYQFPDDLEAKAFLVLQLWDNRQHGTPLPSRLAVEALGQQVLAKSPMHPGIHHYLIHLWNRGEGDKHAIANAARCGQSSPAIAHLWHMSGHTFSELRRYDDAAWQQEASARVDHAYMAAARVMPEQIHNYAHNNDWLVKNLGYLGRVHDGIDLAKNLTELPRLGPGKDAAWKMGRSRLLELGVNFELWDQLIALERNGYLSPDPDAQREVERLRALGIAGYSKGDAAYGDQKLNGLEKRLADLRTERVAAADKAEAEARKANKLEDQVAKAMADALRGFSSRVSSIENALTDLRLTRALSRGDHKTVKAQLALAKDIPSLRLARIHLALGDAGKAEQLARDLIKADAGQVLTYALLADILTQANRPDDARKAFEQLRERSAGIDLDLPAFARLAPLAQKLALPADWRVAKSPPADAGKRPPLAQLGPFRWHPYAATPFTLTDSHGKTVSLDDYRGKPVLVVFYLGAGCSRCIAQLNSFAPLAKAYADAGIEIVAVSTDTPEGLSKTFDQAKEPAGFPFKIVSDHALDAFRAYRAYDDFEKMGLHGTFLIDGTGFVRWQNISYAPFTEPKWLLDEAKRLLAIPVDRLRQLTHRSRFTGSARLPRPVRVARLPSQSSMSTQVSRRRFLTCTATALAASVPFAKAAEGSAWTIGCLNRPWVKWSADEMLDGVVSAGYRLVGLQTPSKTDPFVGPTATRDYLLALKEKIAARKLTTNVSRLRTKDAAPFDEATPEIRQQVDNARLLGLTQLIHTGPGKPEQYENWYRLMNYACRYAADAGIQVVIKPHGGATAASADLLVCLEKINHPNLGIWYDAGNIIYYTDKDPLRELEPIIAHVTAFTAKDCADKGSEVMIQFGQGKVDFTAILARLKRANFNGPIMVESCAIGSTAAETATNAAENRKFLEATLARI